jgi:hypothetical protein
VGMMEIAYAAIAAIPVLYFGQLIWLIYRQFSDLAKRKNKE